MAKAIKFNADFFDSGAVKYASGQCYPVTEETARIAAMGNAEEVNVKSAEIEPTPVDVPVVDAPIVQ